MSTEELLKLKKEDLQQKCKENNLPYSGTKIALASRLCTAKTQNTVSSSNSSPPLVFSNQAQEKAQCFLKKLSRNEILEIINSLDTTTRPKIRASFTKSKLIEALLPLFDLQKHIQQQQQQQQQHHNTNDDNKSKVFIVSRNSYGNYELNLKGCKLLIDPSTYYIYGYQKSNAEVNQLTLKQVKLIKKYSLYYIPPSNLAENQENINDNNDINSFYSYTDPEQDNNSIEEDEQYEDFINDQDPDAFQSTLNELVVEDSNNVDKDIEIW